jgi:hypothetical protein
MSGLAMARMASPNSTQIPCSLGYVFAAGICCSDSGSARALQDLRALSNIGKGEFCDATHHGENR